MKADLADKDVLEAKRAQQEEEAREKGKLLSEQKAVRITSHHLLSVTQLHSVNRQPMSSTPSIFTLPPFPELQALCWNNCARFLGSHLLIVRMCLFVPAQIFRHVGGLSPVCFSSAHSVVCAEGNRFELGFKSFQSLC